MVKARICTGSLHADLQAELAVGTHSAKQLKPQVRSTLHVTKRLVQLLPTVGQRLQSKMS